MPYVTYAWTATLWYDGLGGVVDHAAEAKANLIWQYQGLPRMEAALAALMAPADDLERVTYEVLAGRCILTAIGDQLDILGRIVGQERGPLADAPYRLMLLGRIFVNKGDFTIPQIYELLHDVLGIDPVEIVEYPPAALQVGGAGMSYPSQIADLMFNFKGGGIRLDFLTSARAVGTIFRTSSTLGADEVSLTEGTKGLAGNGGYLADTRWSR